MAWVNEYQTWLTESQSLQNAQMVVNFLSGKDWSKEAIAALIGNMRHESSINPNMYEYGYSWGDDRGFGLVQWTPRSKFWTWGSARGYSEKQLRSGDSQLARIDYEVENNIQWIPKESNFNGLTFKEFRTNSRNLTVDELTEAFTWGYERPNQRAGEESMPLRKEFANKAFNNLDWSSIGPDPDPDPDPEVPDYDFGSVINFFNNFSGTLKEEIEKMLIVNLFDYGKSRTFGNNFLKVDKTYSNTYKIKPTLNFDKTVNDILDEAKNKLGDLIESINPDRDPDPEENIPDPDPDPDPPPSDNDMYFPVDYTARGINFWYPPYTPGSEQEAMDFGGPRRGGRIHAGYDIGAGGVRGNKVYSIRSGKVTFVGNEGTRGFVIRIKHSSDNKHAMYMHLVVNSNTVNVGDNVKAGDQIGVMGDTPNGMYSIHLHVEIDETGEFNGYEYQDNPREYLQVTGNNKTNLPNPAKK